MSAFDGLTFKQGLTQVGIPADQAEALSDLIRDHVVGNVANKEELLHMEQRLNEKTDRVEERLNEKIDRVEERLRSEIKQVEQSLTVKVGSMFIVAVGILLAAQQML